MVACAFRAWATARPLAVGPLGAVRFLGETASPFDALTVYLLRVIFATQGCGEDEPQSEGREQTYGTDGL
jgi:hypothetical protein